MIPAPLIVTPKNFAWDFDVLGSKKVWGDTPITRGSPKGETDWLVA